MSPDAATFLMAFASLTELNTIKRMFRAVHLPMRQLPACTADWGCGFALVLNPSNVASVQQAADDAKLTFRLFRLTSNSEPVPLTPDSTEPST